MPSFRTLQEKRMIPNREAAFGLLSIILLFLAGCSTPGITLNYSPSSVLTASGAVTVSDFKHLPAINGKVAPNEIRNTALGTPKFEQDISLFFRDAVFKELRFVGVKVDGKDRVLTGEIQDFLIDDLGFSADFLLKVHYVVKSTDSQDLLYECEKVTQKKTAKFGNPFGTINEVVKLNIDELLKEPKFIDAIK
jgi:hypothetical protein